MLGLEDKENGRCNLEGVAANVKLLLKLIQDHKNACKTQRNDGRRMLRVAGMMTILEMVRTRIQKCQSFGTKRSELLKVSPAQSPKDKRLSDPIMIDEKEKLRRELSASLAARKSLEIMCSGLGKEKEIMMGELAKKAHELAEMEEHINDLKAQNETLLEKVQECAEMHKDEEKETQGNMELQERNKSLSKQLLKSLDEYRSMKRKLKDVHEENMAMQATMEEMGVKVSQSLEKIRSYRQHSTTESDEIVDIEEGISELEHMFKCFELNERKHGKKSGETVHPNSKISSCKTVIS
ncbi:hypothetical protein Ccrd_025431 [Cynara cardunculus var. scolymus]|uniref:Uncharacterized protein n=1 Tax=Cynara cardunculus var. scolymus TaxID=59895 RepID=A0A118JQF1_CYNCS|nr:hypothetical protein Ccrd_025431 [Cynara cardunculus var. scolymus]